MINAHLTIAEVREFIGLDKACQGFLLGALDKLKLSARSYYRCLKVARTIADLAQSGPIDRKHLAEALGYRGRL